MCYQPLELLLNHQYHVQLRRYPLKALGSYELKLKYGNDTLETTGNSVDDAAEKMCKLIGIIPPLKESANV